MAHAQSSQGDESQSNRYSLFCDPLSVHNSTVHTSDSSSAPRFFGSQGLDFPEKHIEGLSAYSGCSSSYPAEGSPSRWQLSNPNSDLHFVSSNESSEKSTLINSSVAQLHIPQVQCSSSNFTWNNFHNGGWQQSPNPTISYISQISSVLPPSSFLALPSEATGTPVMLEGAMLRELLGRLGNSHCISNVSSLETTLATGSAQRLGSPMAAGCSWNHQVDASCNIGLTVDLSNGGLTHQGTGLAVSHGLAQFSSDPGFAERAARLSSFSNISQLSQPPLVTSSGMNLSPEASHFVDKSSSAIQASITTPSGPTPQSSPKVIRYQNASNEFSIWENAGKMDSVHDLVPMGETEAEDAGDIKRYKSATCHHSVVAIDETKSLPNSASPANSSGSGPYSAMCGLISSKGLVVDTLGMKQQKCISGDKAKEISCLSENSKQKMDEVRSKRQKTSETSKVKEPKLKVERSSSENSGNSSPSSTKENTKPPEPPKLDYIHVRARRGQATDSHSLAERVRREKISERMKFLQDLVPGCSKVTGKALMLDEIINYVQSLQRQVEFLSMKLAAVNPRLDFNFKSLLSKEMLSSLCPSPTLLLGADNSTNLLQLHTTQKNGLQLGLSCGLDLRPSGTPVENNFQRSRRSPVAVDTYASSGSQASGVWDGELQSVVQMGFGSGSFPSGQMKVEL